MTHRIRNTRRASDFADAQHGLDHSAPVKVVDSCVDLPEVVKGDEAVKGKQALTIQIDQFRDKVLGCTHGDAHNYMIPEK